MKIDEGYWYVSLDKGTTWTKLGKATGEDGADGNSFFKSVTEDDNYVYFTLTDDTSFILPKSTILTVTFDPADKVSLLPGEPTAIAYVVTSSLTPVKVQVITSADIKAIVTPAGTDGLSGTIDAVAQGAIDKYSQIIVFVDNGEKVFTQSFTIGNGGLQGPTTGVIGGYEWVDLGLPSGLRWATCNVGASQPEEFGDYFAWGETEAKANYSLGTYKLCNGARNTHTKYCTNSAYGTVDGKTILEAADDAASANWGLSWRMPTSEEWTELRTKCTWTWISLNNVKGSRVTGPNGKSLFLPAAGYRNSNKNEDVKSFGCYWASSLFTMFQDCALESFCSSGTVGQARQDRFCGLSVRAVTE